MALEKKYTAIRKLVTGSNDLLTWCQEHGELGKDIITEWDEGRNGSMSMYKPGSGKVVYWKCNICNEIYKKAIKFRVNGNRHEPCGRKIGKEKLIQYHREHINYEDSLAGKRPSILKEWDYELNTEKGILPQYITIDSGRKVYWICPDCGNHYKRAVRERTRLGYGCKECRKHN